MATAARHSAKQYGVRYGRRLREKIGKIAHEKRVSNSCPYCHYNKVKRIAAGIWFCNKCSSKFAAGAYYVGKKLEKVDAETQSSEKIEKSATASELLDKTESGEVIESG